MAMTEDWDAKMFNGCRRRSKCDHSGYGVPWQRRLAAEAGVTSLGDKAQSAFAFWMVRFTIHVVTRELV